MVDFQSRDTRRGPSLDDEDDDAEDDERAGEKQGSETATDSDEATETADDGADSTSGEPTEPGVDRAPDADPSAAEATASDPLATDSAESDPTPDPPADSDGPGAHDDPLAADSDGSGAHDDPLAADSDGSGAADDSLATEGADAAAAEPAPDRDTDQPTADRTAPQASPETTVQAAVVTVGMDGDERVETAVTTAFESAGHSVTVRERLRGEYDSLQQVVDRLVDRADVDVVVTAGGIGIGTDEVTIEAVHPLFEKALPGFGEAFRALLFEHIGTGIVSVRSTAGVANGTLVFCLPGDVDAAELAVEEILVPETPALVDSLR